MTTMPDFVEFGAPARLFPALAETNRERRVTSIFLAVLAQVHPMAVEVLSSVGQRVGVRTKISTFTEVVLKEKTGNNCRPDGLIVLETGSRRWSALVETKIARNELTEEQVTKYIELARANGVDAVITVSNQFVSRADHSPVPVSKKLLRKTDLFHWSWSWLATQCELLSLQDGVEDAEQMFLMRELMEFLDHPSTGVERFTQMGPEWKSLVQSVSNETVLKRTSPEVEEAVACWHAEERDLSLHLSTNIKTAVSVKIERKLRDDPGLRAREAAQALVENRTLTSIFQVPNLAGDINVVANLGLRTISASMVLKAPGDRKSTKARINWVLRMLPEDDERLLLSALWPGRVSPTTRSVAELRTDPLLLQTDNPDLVPHSFEVKLVERTGARFSGRKTFIEDLEVIVPKFYELAAAHLRAWQPAPPQPIKKVTLEEGETPIEDFN
ncbi:hypothetical protein [Leisingera sp. JC1]|uniref:hypothetical protein n=1 Tax=Leisingera sp. JC1 TaxID=1855282 RepID=UPI000802B745|nr:hypothetical protein [Leisingera sp. JC1]OBY24792.1 hypothetical protein A9D60_08655 [Leisingera sp. JC1]